MVDWEQWGAGNQEGQQQEEQLEREEKGLAKHATTVAFGDLSVQQPVHLGLHLPVSHGGHRLSDKVKVPTSHSPIEDCVPPLATSLELHTDVIDDTLYVLAWCRHLETET